MAADWTKLKVVDLKKELSARGLLQTGLKADLAARLAADDEAKAATENLPEVALDAPGEGQSQNEGASGINDELSEAKEKDGTGSVARDADLETVGKEQSIAGPTAPSSTAEVVNTSSGDLEGSTSIAAAAEEKQSSEQSQDLLPTANKDVIEDATPATVEGIADQPTELPSQAEGGLEPEQTKEVPKVPSEEVMKDSQKRKRRSLTPDIPSDEAANKKVRHSGDDLEPKEDEVATTKEDAEWVEKHNGVDAMDVNAEAEEVAAPMEGVETGPTIVDVAKEEVVIEPVGASTKEEPTENNMDFENEALSKEKDARFKDLHSSSNANMDVKEEDSMEGVETDRMVSPAIHPATTALYIRNFMRPINPPSLREYFELLATPPSSHTDPSIITEFFLDQIRTHAFVCFRSISAASRVRSAIHDTVWPQETNRKPLWADFIPPEKLPEWIELEQSTAGPGRTVGRKWEVVYDEDDYGSIVAVLRETDPRNVPARQMNTGNMGVGRLNAPIAPRGMVGAPSGPRSSLPQDPNPYETRMRGDMDRRPSNFRSGEQAFGRQPEKEFMTTTASPQLWYQPVSKEIVNARLDNMDRVTRKDYKRDQPAGECNRYTFEDGDKLVDRGLEVFEGIRNIRGGFGGRPPRGDGFRRGDRGGGGGYRGRREGRGDSYMGRGGGGRYGGGGGGGFRADDGYRGTDDGYRGTGRRQY